MPAARKGKGKKKSPSERLAKAVEKRSVDRPLSTPITSFRIPVIAAALPHEAWSTYQIKYGMPVIKLHRYHDDEELHEACQVPVYIGGEPTVYLPLPLRYRDAWVLLCYRIVYWANIRDFWGIELQENSLSDQRREIAQNLKDNCAVRLLSNIVARRLVVEELLKLEWRLQWGNESVYTLNEYLVRDRRDLLFTKFQDVGLRDAKYLKSDPCDPRNDKLFRANYMRGYSGDYMAPPPDDDSWIAGDIKGLQDIFKSRIRPQSYNFFIDNSHDQRRYADLPFSARAKVPACWSETHEPALQFLSEEKYLRLFIVNDVRADSTIAKNLSASGVRPLEHTPFDSQEVEALLQEYHRGDAELIPVLDYLTVLIGARYHQIISTLLNNITKDLGGDSLIPYVTAVAAARQSYLAEVGNASAGPSGSNMDQDLSSHAQSPHERQGAPNTTEGEYEAKIAEAFSGCIDLDAVRLRLLGMFRNRLHPVISIWVKKYRSLEEAEAAQADLVEDLQHEDYIASAEEDFAAY